MNREEILKQLKNVLFKSKEEKNSIEHVDMGYKEFVELLDKLSETAFDEGYGCAVNNW